MATMSSFSRWCSEEVKPIPPTLPCVPQLPTSVGSKTASLPGAHFSSPRALTPIPSTNQKPLLGLEKKKPHSSITHNCSLPIKTVVQVKNWPNSNWVPAHIASAQSKSDSLIPSRGSNDIFLTPTTGTQKNSSGVEKRTSNCSIVSSGKIASSSPGTSATAKFIIVHRGAESSVNSVKNSSTVKCTIVPSKPLTIQSSTNAGGPAASASLDKKFLSTTAHSSNISGSTYKVEERDGETSQVSRKSKDYFYNSKLAGSSVFVVNNKRNTAAKHSSKVTSVPSKAVPFAVTSSGRHLLSSSSKQGCMSNARRVFHTMGSSSFDEEDTEVEDFLSPSDRWAVQPKSYRGPRREAMMAPNRRSARRAAGLQYPDTTTTDGETSGMGSSLDELVESSTESASESSCSLAVVHPSHSLQLQLGGQGTRNTPFFSDNSSKITNSCIKSKSPVYSRECPSSKKSLHNIQSINLDVSHSSHHEKSSVLFIPSSLSSQDHVLSHSADVQQGNTNTQPTLSPLRCKSRSNSARNAPSSSSAEGCDALQGPASSAALPKCPPVKRRGGWPKGRKRKPEIPGAKPPKAPQTAYVLFLADRRKFYDPREYTFGEITKRVAMEWNSLPQPQRDVYERRCEQEKNRYRNELQAYRQSHDFQLIMRKKRLKRALSGGNPEDSSDCTDGPEDDAPEELYCSKCDKLFSSLHNKRLHLYGRPHNRAQPVRKPRNTTPQNIAASDYNTDNNTDYDDSSAAPSSVYSMPPHHRSSSTTSPSTSPFPPTVSSPGTSVAATSASEDEEIPVHAGTKRDRRHEPRYGECSVASIAEEGNDGDLEDGAEDDEAPVNQPVGASLASLRAQLAERELEIRRLRLAVQKSQQQRQLLQQTLESERQRQSESNAPMHSAPSSYAQPRRDALGLWTSTSAITSVSPVDNRTLLAYQVKKEVVKTVSSSAHQEASNAVRKVNGESGGSFQIIDYAISLDDGANLVNNGKPGSEGDARDMVDHSAQAKSFIILTNQINGLEKGISSQVKNIVQQNKENNQSLKETSVANIDVGAVIGKLLFVESHDSSGKPENSNTLNIRRSGGNVMPNVGPSVFSDEQTRFYQPLSNDRDSKKHAEESISRNDHASHSGSELDYDMPVPSSAPKTNLDHNLLVFSSTHKNLPSREEQDNSQKFSSRMPVSLNSSSATMNSFIKNIGDSPIGSLHNDVEKNPHLSKTADQVQEYFTSLPDCGGSISIDISNETVVVSSDAVSSYFNEVPSTADAGSRMPSSVSFDCDPVEKQSDRNSSIREVHRASFQPAPLLDHDYTSFCSSLNISSVLPTLAHEPLLFDRPNAKQTISHEGSNHCIQGTAAVGSGKVVSFTKTLDITEHEHFPWPNTGEVYEDISKVANEAKISSEKRNGTFVADSDQKVHSSSNVNLGADLICSSSVRNLGDICKAALGDYVDKSECISTVSWMTPNKKTADFSNIDSDSSTDFLSYAAYNSGLSDHVYSTDTEDCCSDSMSTNATFNKLSLVDSFLEENDSRDQFSFQSDLSNVSPGRFFEEDFQLNHDNDLMDLNELLGRCLHNENFPEVTTCTSDGYNPQVSYSCVNSHQSYVTETTDQLSLEKPVPLNSIPTSSESSSTKNRSGTESGPSPSQDVLCSFSDTEVKSPLRYQEQMDAFL